MNPTKTSKYAQGASHFFMEQRNAAQYFSGRRHLDEERAQDKSPPPEKKNDFPNGGSIHDFSSHLPPIAQQSKLESTNNTRYTPGCRF